MRLISVGRPLEIQKDMFEVPVGEKGSRRLFITTRDYLGIGATVTCY